ncbi:MAG TPA: hypothetical protein VFG74_04750 [Miltoncostaeaceae bacterium]|jgi:hypothetical protein|nr:hypothetical protein [Miltoncostaeaceae bacterium]
MTTTHKLPRAKHADRPRPDETVLKQSGADLQNGWLARHGTLFATDQRLLFVPTLLDTALRGKRREIPLGDITEIERFPRSPGDMPRGGKRPRMLIHTDACVYEFMVGDLDAWIDSLERVYQRRARETGDDHMPRITREGYVNLLLDD